MHNHAGEKNPNYKHGLCVRKMCRDCGKPLVNKYALRCKSCAQIGKLSHRYGKTAANGQGSYYNGIWMRSSYELKFAKFLDSKNIKWEFEPKTFDVGNGETYTPDFYLPETDEWVEIKGYWRDDARVKFELCKLRYPELKILLVNKYCLNLMGVEV